MSIKWWQDEVVYQIYPKSFSDSNNDGVGDLPGITQKLDYLQELGVTSIWICPIYQSPMVDNGYDISDYLSVAPEYGSMDDLKELIQEAKDRNIKIILDLVVNHTSDEHAWFQAALADPESKYRDYYIFKESKTRPNNWRSVFGGSVWEKLPNEDVYYYHSFDKRQPDLNWENPDLRQEIYQMIRQWFDLGIAGFRVDAITFIKKDLTFQDGPADGADGLVKCADTSRNYPGIEVFLEELKEAVFAPNDAVTIAEAAGVRYDQLEMYAGPDGFFSMIFDFSYADIDVESGSEWFHRLDWTLEDFFATIEKSQNELQKASWGAPFIENHDQPRATSKYLREHARNPEAVKALAVLYFFLRGTAFIYQGQELGMVNFERQSLDQFDDISSIDQYHRGLQEGFTEEYMMQVLNDRSRDNTRTPMPWSDQVHGGFSKAEPWLEVTETYPEINVSQQDKDPQSILNFYREMTKFKRGDYHQVLNYGDIEFVERRTPGVFIYRRYLEGESVLVLVNLTNQEKTVSLDQELGQVLFGNQPQIQETSQGWLLDPFAAKIIKEATNNEK